MDERWLVVALGVAVLIWLVVMALQADVEEEQE